MSEILPDTNERSGQRGPQQHEMRDRVVEAASARFRHYGYSKTSVAEIAADLKVSSAYIYKFFDSKVAICEAVCARMLGALDEALWAEAQADKSAAERLRRLYKLLLEQSVSLFFNDRKMHDMVVTGLEHHWSSITQHVETMTDVARKIIQDGRASGEFERRAPLEQAVSAVACTFAPFSHPVLLEMSIGQDLEAEAEAVASLVLRGLAAD